MSTNKPNPDGAPRSDQQLELWDTKDLSGYSITESYPAGDSASSNASVPMSPVAQLENAICNDLVREFLRSGISQQKFVGPKGSERELRVPRQLDEEGPLQDRCIVVTKQFLKNKLDRYREVYGVAKTSDLPVDKLFKFDPRLVDGRYRLTGPQLRIQDGPLVYLIGRKITNRRWSWGRCRRALKRYLAEDSCPFAGAWHLPSLATIKRAIKRIPKQDRVLLFLGAEAHWANFGIAPFKDWGRPHEYAVCDTLTLTSLNFIDPETKEFFHPQVTFIMEASTRTVLAHVVHKRKLDRIGFIALIRQAILKKKGDGEEFRPHGKFHFLLTDRAGEFKNSLVKLTCEQLGIEKIESLPRCPSSNGLAERLVQTLKKQFMEYLEDAAARDPRLNPSAGISYRHWDYFKKQLHTYIYREYHGTVHQTLGMSPEEAYWQASILPEFLKVNESEVRRITSIRQRRTVVKRGVYHRKVAYVCDDIQSEAGEDVEIIIDPDEPNKIAKIVIDGKEQVARVNVPGTDTKLTLNRNSYRRNWRQVAADCRDLVIESNQSGDSRANTSKDPDPGPRKESTPNPTRKPAGSDPQPLDAGPVPNLMRSRKHFPKNNPQKKDE